MSSANSRPMRRKCRGKGGCHRTAALTRYCGEVKIPLVLGPARRRGFFLCAARHPPGGLSPAAATSPVSDGSIARVAPIAVTKMLQPLLARAQALHAVHPHCCTRAVGMVGRRACGPARSQARAAHRLFLDSSFYTSVPVGGYLLRRNRQPDATDKRWVPGAAEQGALPPAREKRKIQ